MRTRSLKRARIDRQATKVRHALVEEIGQCELTGNRDALCIHEIARGDRVHAFDKRYATLCLSGTPIDGGLSAHQIVERWPKAKQLALLLAVRPKDFDLEAYNQIATSRVSQEDVAAYRDEVELELGKYRREVDWLWA